MSFLILAFGCLPYLKCYGFHFTFHFMTAMFYLQVLFPIFFFSFDWMRYLLLWALPDFVLTIITLGFLVTVHIFSFKDFLYPGPHCHDKVWISGCVHKLTLWNSRFHHAISITWVSVTLWNSILCLWGCWFIPSFAFLPALWLLC